MKRLAMLAVPAAALAVAGLPPASAAPSKHRSLTVLESDLRLTAVDLPPQSGESGPPSHGDEVILSKRLSSPSGRRLGRMQLVCVVTEPRASLETSVFQCNGSYGLRGGTLAISLGGVLTARTTRVAVTGGTGTYAGARGTITVRATQGDDTRDTVRLAG